MPEELCVYRSFRNGSAVDGQVFARLAAAVLVDYLGNVFLACAAFAFDQHGEVGGRNCHGCFKRPVERRVVSNDVVAVFQYLKLLCVHIRAKL